MKIEKLIKIAKPLTQTELKHLKGGTTTVDPDVEDQLETADGVIQDDLAAG